MKKALVIPRHHYASSMITENGTNHDNLAACHKLHTYDPESTVSVISGVYEAGLVTAPFKLTDRSHCETNPTYLQIIPYIILLSENNEIFMYKRGQKGNEERLHQLFSMGLGGHIEIDTPSEQYGHLVKDTMYKEDDECIIGDGIDIDRTLLLLITETIQQELQEEVGLELSNFEFQKILDSMPGFYTLYCDRDLVGSVHLGVTGILKISKDRLSDHEKDVIQKGNWVALEKIRPYLEGENGQFEQWSEVCMSLFEEEIQYPMVDLIPNLESLKTDDMRDVPDDIMDDDFVG